MTARGQPSRSILESLRGFQQLNFGSDQSEVSLMIFVEIDVGIGLSGSISLLQSMKHRLSFLAEF
jgi:hypothetical protein